ncbi:L-type lectin-domain containing receptor kinase IX.1 [Cryptomeria japonica]|uniref:L-type lectin-domain containing receptor kinase IX.1 n=1 Tax=Cryptomeria japonica TaxID=3369 RepID=UPI0027DA0A76|nr:L-type lectin-domain containing receptor kinase IX.1 [Cryptomeria japonica]
MANFYFSKLISLACLFCYASTANISLNSVRGLSFIFPKFRAPETDEIPVEIDPLPELDEIDGLDFVGDAAVSGNVVHLTNSSSSQYNESNQSSGRIVYNETMQLSSTANFSTHFVFSMYSDKNEFGGDGIAFFLSSKGDAYNMPQFKRGGYFGLVGDNLKILPNFFAVVFSSTQKTVGTLANSFSELHYLKNATVSDLNNGTELGAWINYNGQVEMLKVYLASDSRSSKSPKNCILSQRVNLSKYLNGNVSLGFSSAAVGSNETHNIHSWSFNSGLYSINTSTGNNSSSNGLGQRNGTETSTSKKIFLGVGCSMAVCIAGALWGYFSFLRRKRAPSITGQNSTGMDLEKLLHHIPRRYKIDDLIVGTNNFSEDQKLGQGGFGGVYKCTLVQTNEIVAVKRISEGSKQGIKEFVAEVSIVSRLRHRNLVQLLGWCYEQDQLLLVYEYMSNGSLDRHIFTKKAGEEEPQVLQWSMRYKIVTEIASALLYLHEEWEECVVHRDVKSSNILLDGNFSAKIGDFGLARMVKHEHVAQTTQAAGTVGYLAPECWVSGKTGPESDVYSFGAVALEIASGKKAIDVSLAEFDRRLVVWVWDLYGQGRLLEAADVRLNGKFKEQEIERLMVVGLWCSHPDAASRPKMKQVLKLLNFEVAAPIIPSTMPVPSYAHTSITTGPSRPLVSHSLPTTLSPR